MSETMPEEYSERVINTRLKAVFYKQTDVKGLKIVSSPDVEISEIIITFITSIFVCTFIT